MFTTLWGLHSITQETVIWWPGHVSTKSVSWQMRAGMSTLSQTLNHYWFETIHLSRSQRNRHLKCFFVAIRWVKSVLSHLVEQNVIKHSSSHQTEKWLKNTLHFRLLVVPPQNFLWNIAPYHNPSPLPLHFLRLEWASFMVSFFTLKASTRQNTNPFSLQNYLQHHHLYEVFRTLLKLNCSHLCASTLISLNL